MVWKVFIVRNDKILKAGFESEEEARDWLGGQNTDPADPVDVDEMDDEEFADWQELNGSDEGGEDEDAGDFSTSDALTNPYGDDYFDGADIDDSPNMTEMDDDDY